MNQLCKVCGEPAAGFHFGAFTCEGCKSFFGRTCNNVSSLGDCKNGGGCVITRKNRTACKACRLRKCLGVGMSKSGSRYGRRSNWFKIHCLLQDSTSQNPEEAIEKTKKLLEEIKTASLNSSLEETKQEVKTEDGETSQEDNGSPSPTVSSSDTHDPIPSGADNFIGATPPPFSWLSPETPPVPAETLSLFAALSPFLFTAGLAGGFQSGNSLPLSSVSQLPNFAQYYPYLLSQISNASTSIVPAASAATSSSHFFTKTSSKNEDEEEGAGGKTPPNLHEDKFRGIRPPSHQRRNLADEQITAGGGEPLNLRANFTRCSSSPYDRSPPRFEGNVESDSTSSTERFAPNSHHEYLINSSSTKTRNDRAFSKRQTLKVEDMGFKRSCSSPEESYEIVTKRRRKSQDPISFFRADDESTQRDDVVEPETTIPQRTHERYNTNKLFQERKFAPRFLRDDNKPSSALQEHEQNEPIDLSVKTCSLTSNSAYFRDTKESDTDCSSVLACSMTLTPIISPDREALSSGPRVEQSSNAIDLSCRV